MCTFVYGLERHVVGECTAALLHKVMDIIGLMDLMCGETSHCVTPQVVVSLVKCAREGLVVFATDGGMSRRAPNESSSDPWGEEVQ
ncbi:hypothetical protein HAX54_005740, partial [Datura stramonium]|nr:hypothetical protein [Datura stramonium]